jgi:hypothetical protein
MPSHLRAAYLIATPAVPGHNPTTTERHFPRNIARIRSLSIAMGGRRGSGSGPWARVPRFARGDAIFWGFGGLGAGTDRPIERTFGGYAVGRLGLNSLNCFARRRREFVEARIPTYC